MEIERKYLIDKNKIPFQPSDFPCRRIEQGYLCTEPVVRVRRDQDDCILTYKSKGLMAREEYNLPLTKEAYLHLREKSRRTSDHQRPLCHSAFFRLSACDRTGFLPRGSGWSDSCRG